MPTVVKVTHAREDYRGILEPAIVCLGVVTPRGIPFVAPESHLQRPVGSTSNLYFQNMDVYLQFNLITSQHQELWKLTIFFRTYVKAWATASIASKASSNDLNLKLESVPYN